MYARTFPAIILALQFSAAAFGHHFRYTANLNGLAESPPNVSTGLGHVVVSVDFDLNILEIDAEFDSLLGTVTEAHIHAPSAAVGSGIALAATPVPAFADFPLGVASGNYQGTFNLGVASSYNPAFIAQHGGLVGDAYAIFGVALNDRKAYFDIHTSAFPDGEIRGFLSYVEGDYNDNGRVDSSDYILWRKTYHGEGEDLVADGNNDEFVDELDYDTWQRNFGNVGLSFESGSGSSLSATVPEPGMPALIAFAFLAPNFRARIE